MYDSKANPVPPVTTIDDQKRLINNYTIIASISTGPNNTKMFVDIMLFLSLKYPPTDSTAKRMQHIANGKYIKFRSFISDGSQPVLSAVRLNPFGQSGKHDPENKTKGDSHSKHLV